MIAIKSISRIFSVLLVAMALAFSAMGITPAHAQSATTWYVATTGNDSNSCSDAGSPCLTINAAIGKAADGDTIKVAIGTYSTETVLIEKSITLSGGWDTSFTTQNGLSIIDGGTVRVGLVVWNSDTVVVVDHFQIQRGFNEDGGGGILNHGILTINDTVIRNNKAGRVDAGGFGGGGGILNHHNGIITLNRSTVSSNVVIGDPGGGFPGSGIVNESDVSNSFTINNSTISGNKGAEAIFNGGEMTVNNTTITGNTAGLINSVYGGSVSVQNSILADNLGNDCEGVIHSTGYNLIGNNNGCEFLDIPSDLVGNWEHSINALLGPLQNNGGLTSTHALLSGSPAINAGNPEVPGSVAVACQATDQRGVARLETSPCDMGAYELDVPMVASIKRADPNPTGAAQVAFTVKFSETVTGVRTIAPFSDFALIKTGLTGTSITAVSGSGNVYTVTVKTGSGEGTIRLDVVDRDTIQDASGNLLGGAGLGNGNYTIGAVYTLRSYPAPLLPVGKITDRTPTYKWNILPPATKYQYQLVQGTRTIYSKIVNAAVCEASACLVTPATTLNYAEYKWRVRAMINGAWKAYSAYKTFTLAAPAPPKPGFWKGSTDFYVNPASTHIHHYAMYINVAACNIYNRKITYTASVPILNGKFKHNGAFRFDGSFTTTTLVSKGHVGLLDFFISGCGYVSGGPFDVTNRWKSSSQASAVSSEEFTLTVVEPDAETFFYDFDLVNP